MYKKRIKDWAIDKNLKSDKLPTSPRTRQRRDAAQSEPQSSVRGTLTDSQNISNYVNSCPYLTQQFQDGTLPSAEEAMQTEYRIPTTILPPQQDNDSSYWASAGQSHGDGSYPPSLSQSVQLAEQALTSDSLHIIRDRFLEASEAITRRDAARLFNILNPAYDAISNVAATEATQLLAVIVDLFELLYRRTDHQDMLRQLLHYVFALIPDAVRQDQFLSCNSQVLNLLGRSGYDSPFGVPLDMAGSAGSGPTASRLDNDYYEQPSGAGLAFDSKFRGNLRHPY